MTVSELIYKLDMIYKITKPTDLLANFVESFWMLESEIDQDKEVVILPDGRIDIIFAWSEKEPLHVMLMELDRESAIAALSAGTTMFAVSFKLLALEYILDIDFVNLNRPLILPNDFWGVNANDLKNFDSFVSRCTKSVLDALGTQVVDTRKKKLFELIYEINGAMSVATLSEKSCWTARQINRYFNERVGISLKKYCDILRFRASFTDLKEGRLFPRVEFFDQAHFIKSIKKLSGVTPRQLSKNQNDRFIQLSTLLRE